MKFYKSLCLLACIVATTDCARRQEDHSMHPRQFSSVDPATVPWREVPLPSKENLYTKTLLADSQTGTGVDLLQVRKSSARADQQFLPGFLDTRSGFPALVDSSDGLLPDRP
jgi:hypothetical protein